MTNIEKKQPLRGHRSKATHCNSQVGGVSLKHKLK